MLFLVAGCILIYLSLFFLYLHSFHLSVTSSFVFAYFPNLQRLNIHSFTSLISIFIFDLSSYQLNFSIQYYQLLLYFFLQTKMNIFDIENNLDNTKCSQSGTFRPRKSIFASTKPKADTLQPTVLLNGQTLDDQRIQKYKTSPNFYSASSQIINSSTQLKQNKQSVRRTTQSFYRPQSQVSRVIITNPYQSQCIRPSSVGKQSIVIKNYPQHQFIQKPVTTTLLSRSRVVPAQSILTNSRIVPSQTSNILLNTSSSCHLKKKSILVEGRPTEKVYYRQISPVKHTEIIKQIVPQVKTVVKERIPQIRTFVIKDDPNTISQLNKLTSLNQFLNQQYILVNNELRILKNKTCQKQVIDDKTFLQKYLNKIDDIFLRETNQAIHRLDQISQFSCSKSFKKTSITKVQVKKRSQSPTFNKIMNNETSNYTPIKNIEDMRNSSYIGCNYLDPKQINQKNGQFDHFQQG